MMPVALLAGGMATRMQPLTTSIPKALLDVAGRPFIEWQLELLARSGLTDVVLCVGHLGEQIEAVVGDGHRFNLKVKYSEDGPVLKGTAGALFQALPLLGEQFFVLYGDSYLPIDFCEVGRAFVDSGQPALMTVLYNGDRWDASNVVWINGQITQYDKGDRHPGMSYIDYGLGVLTRTALLENVASHDATGPADLADIYKKLAQQGRLAGYEVFTRFYEIGSFQGLTDTISFLQARFVGQPHTPFPHIT